jgi:speckle-type POZ protein
MAHTAVNLTEAARSEHLFKINGFTATKQTPRSFSPSRKCTVGGHDWQIQFCANRSAGPPNHPSDGGAGWVMFRLRLMSKAAGGGVAASFACRLVDPNQPGPGDSPDQISSASFHIYDFHDVYLVRRSKLEGWQCRYLKDDSILVQCAITVLLGEPKNAVASDAGPPPSVPSSDLHTQFGELLWSQKGADVTFHVSGESVSAHRSVLAARSPVFMAQLYGHTKEASASAPCVEVKDMEAEVFRAMLRFIYTDTAPELERGGWHATAMAQHLLEAADRYGLERLKRMCQEKVSTDISVGNVATTLALAEQHGCAKLKANCIEFILAVPENLFALAATEGYKHLEASCPSVLTELLLHLVTKNN